MVEGYNPLLKRDDETPLDHHRRLVYGKLVDRTLADYDYAELSRYVYGEELSADSVRKQMYGSRKTLELLDQEGVSGIEDVGILRDIEERTRAFQKERQRFSDQRREYNKLVAKEGRIEHLEEILASAAEKMAENVGRAYIESPLPVREVSDSEAILVLSDWHYGMTTDNIWNRYDVDVCVNRMREIVQKTEERLLLHACRRLHIVVLGDLIHGAIHVGTRVASEELACEQIMHASELLAQTVEELSQYVPETIVYTTYGNHARTVQNKKESTHRDNMERLIPWWLELRLKEYQDITVIPESHHEFVLFDVCGRSFCATHGDLDSVKTAPRLISALVRKTYNKDIDCVILGDKHHQEGFEELGISSMICGALCGTDEYANGKRLYSTPEQLLLIVNDRDGLDAPYHLKVK